MTLNLKSCKPAIVSCDISFEVGSEREEQADDSFPYRSIIGNLIYLATHKRSDIAVAINIFFRNLENLLIKHQNAVVETVKYLKGTENYDLKLNLGNEDRPMC